jgi:glycolate oxidase FAD binding subunit
MLDTFIDRIRAAHESRTPLIIQGGGSKTFYGNADEGEILSTRSLTGVVDYQPKELVLTARAGTQLAEIEALLAGENQMLAFEPPHFGEFPLAGLPAGGQAGANPIQATLGGSIAAGLSGPRRPYAGAARDFVL